jgi:uncharacterized protein (DUF2267 family)
MSAVGLESLDHTVQLTHIWINDLDERLGWANKASTYRRLKSVPHAIRDWLPVNEAVDLGAQRPGLLRGAYCEQWRPAATPIKERSKSNFLAHVKHAFGNDPMTPIERYVACVFEVMSNKITAGEVNDVRQALPADIRKLWPSP